MAAPMARLTLCDSSDEEIVAVFVRVAGIVSRHQEARRTTKKTPPSGKQTCGAFHCLPQGMATEDLKRHDLYDVKYAVTQLAQSES